MARTSKLSHRQIKAKKAARMWGLVCLLTALLAVPLWWTACAAGYGDSPLNPAFELFASAAFADTALSLFAILAWFEFDAKVHNPFG